MPSKNSVKVYVDKAYYHLFNRGINKQNIFLEPEDFLKFIRIIANLLSEQKAIFNLTTLKFDIVLNDNKLKDLIRLLCYSLMPNHFHLLLQQKNPEDIIKLMQSASIAYTAYFNKKYNHIGPIFQGRYKAVRIASDEQLLMVSAYIHNNSNDLGISPKDYKWSSFLDYLYPSKKDWIKTEQILSFFNMNREEYGRFVISFKKEKYKPETLIDIED